VARLALALSVATGNRYLGHFDVPEAAPVLYLALEGNRTAIRTRTGAIAAGLTSTRRPRVGLLSCHTSRAVQSLRPAWTDELADT